MRRRRAAGGSPAAAETSRSKWKRERCRLAASASPDVSWSSSESARISTKRAKVSVLVVVLMPSILPPGPSGSLDRVCSVRGVLPERRPGAVNRQRRVVRNRCTNVCEGEARNRARDPADRLLAVEDLGLPRRSALDVEHAQLAVRLATVVEPRDRLLPGIAPFSGAKLMWVSSRPASAGRTRSSISRPQRGRRARMRIRSEAPRRRRPRTADRHPAPRRPPGRQRVVVVIPSPSPKTTEVCSSGSISTLAAKRAEGVRLEGRRRGRARSGAGSRPRRAAPLSSARSRAPSGSAEAHRTAPSRPRSRSMRSRKSAASGPRTAT